MQFVANIPYIKCFVKKEYLYDLKKGYGEFEECVLLAVKSMQGRALMFEAYLPQYGACFDKFPISAFVWKTDIKEEEQLSLGEISLWDGFSYDIQVWSKRLLKNCDVQIMLKGGRKMGGEYLFTIDSTHRRSTSTQSTVLAITIAIRSSRSAMASSPCIGATASSLREALLGRSHGRFTSRYT